MPAAVASQPLSPADGMAPASQVAGCMWQLQPAYGKALGGLHAVLAVAMHVLPAALEQQAGSAVAPDSWPQAR